MNPPERKAPKPAPMLSIVTVHFKDLPGLVETLDSLPTGAAANFEWVVVDGGTPLAPGHQADWDRVTQAASTLVSEPDEGIYDAMNKGTALARGGWVLYLNAGDLLHPEFDPERLPAAAPGAPAMLWGRSYDQGPDGEAYPVHTRAPGWLHWGPATAHQAILFRRAALGARPYDTCYRIAADYDLICRLYRAGGGVERIDLPVCIYRLGGRSAHDPRATLREEMRARAKHLGIPGWLNAMIYHAKQAIWATTRRFPGLRKSMRGKV